MVFSRFLRYFIEVARLGSIRKASEQLNVSASAIDRQILQAEEELGVTLFERIPSGLRMTAAGELLLASARSWSRDYERLQEQFVDLRGLKRGTVRIACIEALAEGYVPSLVHSLREQYPGIAYLIEVVDNIEVAERIVSGEVDMGLMLSPQSSKDLTVRAFVEIGTGVIVPSDHPLASRSTIRFNELAATPMIVPQPPLALAELVASLAHATSTTMLLAAGSDNVQMIKSLIMSGAGVGVLSWLDVVTDVEAGRLFFIPLSDRALRPLNLSLCTSPMRRLSAAGMMTLSQIESTLTTLQRRQTALRKSRWLLRSRQR